MKTIQILTPVAILSIASLVAGCAGGREVEVTGEAKAAASATVTGPISIEFFEVPAEGEEAAEEVSIKSIELAQAGAFKETVEVEGDKVRIFALNDLNKDGLCTEGEAWAEAEAAVNEDGTAAPVTLELAASACPARATTTE